MKAPVYSNLRDLGRDYYRGTITCAQYRASRKQLIDQFVEAGDTQLVGVTKDEADDTQLMGVPRDSFTMQAETQETRSAAPNSIVNQVVRILFVLALSVLGTISAWFFLVSGK